MQPNFSTLKPVTDQPNFDALKPTDSSLTKSNSPQTVVEAGLEAGGKAIGNLLPSVGNFAESIWSSLVHPVKTIEGVASIVGGAGSKILDNTVGKGIEKITGKPIQKGDTGTFDSFVNIMKDRYGSLENLQKTATEDPFGFGADVVSLIEGGAGLVGKGEQASKALSATSKIVTAPVTKTAEFAGNAVKNTAKFGLSQATALNADTISEILKNPQKFNNINPELRAETAQKVANALDTRLSELSDMGKGYDTIRQSEGKVIVPPDTVKNVLNKYGVKLDENNRIVTSPESRPLSTGDRTAIQDFIDNYGNVTDHTNNSFLNTREALSNLSKYDSTKTNISTSISRDLRSEFDKLGKTQIPGLAPLDTAYAPERQLLGDLKKDIFDAKGELKPTAISKIANLTGKGKEVVLERVKQIVPDIEERVSLIKAVEDIERASGFKTGAYIRGAVTGGAVLTGNVPAIITAIISHPSVAVPLLKGAGYTGAKVRPILEAVKYIASDVNNFNIPMQSVLLRDRVR